MRREREKCAAFRIGAKTILENITPLPIQFESNEWTHTEEKNHMIWKLSIETHENAI